MAAPAVGPKPFKMLITPGGKPACRMKKPLIKTEKCTPNQFKRYSFEKISCLTLS